MVILLLFCQKENRITFLYNAVDIVKFYLVDVKVKYHISIAKQRSKYSSL